MKKFKKQLLLLLAICFIVPLLLPVTSSAAAKISKSNLIMYVGQTVPIKISGTSKAVTWTSSKKSVASVNSKGKVKALKEGSATIYARVGTSKYKCAVTIKDDIGSVFSEIENWLVGDIWNDGFCDLKWYYTYKTNSVGGKMNLGSTMKKLSKAMSKAECYDDFISSLEGKKYNKIKKYWGNCYPEMKSLYKKVLATDFSTSGNSENDLGADLFNTYMLDAYEELTELMYS